MYYSRSQNENGEKEELKYHLELTSHLAGEFAETFGEKVAGEFCGLYHDAGKASKLFQDVLSGKEHKVNHEAAGAYIAYTALKKNRLLAVVIYAHHKGLKWDIVDELNKSYIEENSKEFRHTGRRFSVTGKEQYSEVVRFYKEDVKALSGRLSLIENNKSFYKNIPQMLHARMLLSCLCDADYIASESHNNKEVLNEAVEISVNFESVIDKLNKYRDSIKKKSVSTQSINNIREEVYNNCVEAASQEPGFFTLTAPTGTGKTLALLAFALHHAKHNNDKGLGNFKRIIIVLPFLSIINQNVKIYSEICENIFEADSTVRYSEETKLVSERWSAPFIITTSVKFFETLFKHKPTDLRFLHSIANSVIVFDEAQSIPTQLTVTTVEALNTLCKMFKCSVVFSTATQPNYSSRKDIMYNSREIINEPQKIYNNTRRVTVEWGIGVGEEVEFCEIAQQMSEYTSVCCVVNKKDHAQKLFLELKKVSEQKECFCISTDLCKSHRDKVIDEVVKRLREGKSCRVVSTSCIEAGIDLDFEYMYRALAPLEAIIQCAGRCNRNGKSKGIMKVFIPSEEKKYPSKEYENGANCVKIIDKRHKIDINNIEHIKEYYNELFKKFNRDDEKLEKAIEDFDFEKVESRYKFINTGGVNVLVPYEMEETLFENLRKEAVSKGVTRSWLRRASTIMVTSYNEDKVKEICEKAYMRNSDGKLISSENIFILNDKRFYDENMGLHFENDSELNYII